MSEPSEPEGAGDGTQPRRNLSMWKTLSRFSLVGIVATLSYFIVANLLMLTDRIRPEFASVLAYLCGMAVSFAGQSRLTFRVKDPSWGHLARFSAMSVSGLLISWLSVVAAEASGYPAFWATVFNSVAIPLLSFVVIRLWVFASPNPHKVL